MEGRIAALPNQWILTTCGAPGGRALPDERAMRKVGTDRRAVRKVWVETDRRTGRVADRHGDADGRRIQ